MTDVLSRQPVVPLDPKSPRGIQAADELSQVLADAMVRLRSEGQPIPDLDDLSESA